MRLVGPAGEQIGIVAINDALRLAQEADLDLVEVAPTARPPVCKLMDYGKFKYESALKARESRKNQAQTVIKEIKLRPKIDPHDYGTKKGHVERFLKAGDKVKVTIMFRGREQSRPELGFKLLQRLAGDVDELGFVEAQPKQDGRNMIMVIGPHKRKLDAVRAERPDTRAEHNAARAERTAARTAATTAARAAEPEPEPQPQLGTKAPVRPSASSAPASSSTSSGPASTPSSAPRSAPPTRSAPPVRSAPPSRPASPRPAPASAARPAPRPVTPGPARPAPPAGQPGTGSAAPRPSAPAGSPRPAAPRPAAPRPGAPRPAAPRPSAPRPRPVSPVPAQRGDAGEQPAKPADSGDSE